MTVVRIEPIVVSLRFYANAVDASTPLADLNTPYTDAAIGMMLDNGVCRVTMGKEAFMLLPRSTQQDIKQQLKTYGVRRVEWRHKGIDHSFHI